MLIAQPPEKLSFSLSSSKKHDSYDMLGPTIVKKLVTHFSQNCMSYGEIEKQNAVFVQSIFKGSKKWNDKTTL
jgi:hypothetical protein